MKKINLVIIFSFSFFAFSGLIYAYDNVVAHPLLTDAAISLYDNQASTKITGLEKDWIIAGSIAEDADPRYLNHFYNPSNGKGLDDWDVIGGYNTHVRGLPTTIWVKDQTSLAALTGDYSENAILENYKNDNKMRAFQGVGHIMHLIQDMSVPAHTRNDSHYGGDPYEEWVKDYGRINYDNANYINVSDLDEALKNVASFSNGNFFSKDTVNITSLDQYLIKDELYNGKKIRYLYKTIEGVNYRMAYTKNISSFDPVYVVSDDTRLNQDYWNLLHPKAIGYSAGVIDYFVKKFQAIDEEKNKLSFWQQSKNLLASAVYNWVNDEFYVRGDNIILANQAWTQGKEAVSVVKDESKILSQATNEAVVQIKDATVAGTIKVAQTTTNITKSATKAVSDTIKALTPKPTGQVLGVKIVEAQEVSLQDEIATPRAIDNQITPVSQSKGPVLVLWSPPVEEIVALAPVDMTPPDVSIVSSPSFISSSTTAFFEFNSNEENVLYQFKLDDGVYQDSSATATLENLSEGSHILSAVAIDSSGNTSASTSASWFVDSIAPTSSVDLLNNKYTETWFVVSWQGSDNSATTTFDVQYKIGATDWIGWIIDTTATSSVFSLPVNNKDTISFRVRAIDLVGNVSDWSAEMITQVDNGQADHVVISEIQVAGSSAKDEFVELYNPTNSDVSLSGWKLGKRTASSTSSYENLLAIFPDKTIKSHGFFLITHPTGYDDPILMPADAVYSSTGYSLTDSNTVILFSDAGQNIVDMVGMGSATSSETSATTNPPSNLSIERKSYSTSTSESMIFGGIDEWQGNGYDSGNNAEDFVVRNVSNPQNSYSVQEPSSWIVKAKMPTPRSSHDGAYNPADGKIYVIGGNNGDQIYSNLESYDVASDTWTVEANAQNARWGLTSEVINNNLIVSGGSPIPSGSVKVEAYNCLTDQWLNLSDMPNPGWGVSSGVVNGKLYIIGGYNWGNYGMNYVREYDPITNAWTMKKNMPTRRSWSGSGVIDNKIYVVGGWDKFDTTDLNILESYDPATDTWTTKASMPVGMRNMGVTELNGKLLVFGGYTGQGASEKYYATVFSYDPLTDSWSRLNDIAYANSGVLAVSINNGVYLIGGGVNNSVVDTVSYLSMQ